MPESTPLSKRYFRSIDGLRLIAAASVVLFHYERMGGLNDLGGRPALFFMLLKAPMFHASLFFILAGFIFTVKYIEHQDTFSRKKFLRRRFLDLFPLHAIATLAMVPFILMRGGVDVGQLVISLGIHLSLLYSFFPFVEYQLNTPSWALSAFFLCYLLLPQLLKLVAKVNTRRLLLPLFALCMVPSVLWTILYANIPGQSEHYFFFHTFAPIRLFEFLLGMFLARQFQLSLRRGSMFGGGRLRHVLSDGAFVLCCLGIYASIALRSRLGTGYTFLSYHVILPLFFAMILALMAREYGLVSRFFGLAAVRKLGQASFYPYLLHIPLISWICFVLEKGFGYYTFLHSPVNVFTFVAAFYTVSAFYFTYVRTRKRKRYVPAAVKAAGA